MGSPCDADALPTPMDGPNVKAAPNGHDAALTLRHRNQAKRIHRRIADDNYALGYNRARLDIQAILTMANPNKALVDLSGHPALYRPESGTRELIMTTSTDPRKVNERYWCGYWRTAYIVLEATPSGWFRVLWEDGHETTHCTPWNPDRDKVLSYVTV